MAEPNFSYVNYMVCYYCKNISELLGNRPTRACLVNTSKDGKFKRIGFDDAPIDGSKGCEKFESSGLPAHPTALERLIKQNPKCVSIPSDSHAVETSWDFTNKADTYIPFRKEQPSISDVELDKME